MWKCSQIHYVEKQATKQFTKYISIFFFFLRKCVYIKQSGWINAKIVVIPIKITLYTVPYFSIVNVYYFYDKNI